MTVYERYQTGCIQCHYPECADHGPVSWSVHPVVHLLHCPACKAPFVAAPRSTEDGPEVFAKIRVPALSGEVAHRALILGRALILAPQSEAGWHSATERYLTGQAAAERASAELAALDAAFAPPEAG
jgi:hypothetical protein